MPPVRILRCLVTAAVFGSLPQAVLTAQPARVGGVINARNGVPVAGVIVRDSLSDVRTQADSAGRYALVLESGRRLLVIEGPGIRPVVVEVHLDPGESCDLPIMVEVVPPELPELQVTVKAVRPSAYTWTTRYDDFFRRRAGGRGRFLTVEDIRRRGASRVHELLMAMPGVRVQTGARTVVGGPDDVAIQFTGCDDVGARPQVYVDGFQVPIKSWGYATLAVVEALDTVSPANIEFMEVYTSRGQIPPEFATDACAAVVIWTK